MAPSEAPVTIALLADLHYGVRSAIPERRSDIADTLLERAVEQLNGCVRPDVTLVLGDLLEDGSAPGSPEHLSRLRAILDRLDAPYLAIPGNHDAEPELFYRVFTSPRNIEDIAGVRFLAFLDQQEPRHNASRSPTDITRFAAARRDYDGPLVALQHVCLFPPELSVAPFNYNNTPEIISGMREARVTLSISGHYHLGAETVTRDNITYVTAPTLCEAPFPFVVVTMSAGHVSTKRHEPGPGSGDLHGTPSWTASSAEPPSPAPPSP